jgi:hypothetical protein
MRIALTGEAAQRWQPYMFAGGLDLKPIVIL